MAKKYEATVERVQRFWIIQVTGVGVTQARHLRELDEMTRDLIAVMEDVDPAKVDVNYDVRIPSEVRTHLEEADRLRTAAAEAQAQAAAEVRIAVRELKGSGMPLRDIGELLGISYQRAHQLAAG